MEKENIILLSNQNKIKKLVNDCMKDVSEQSGNEFELFTFKNVDFKCGYNINLFIIQTSLLTESSILFLENLKNVKNFKNSSIILLGEEERVPESIKNLYLSGMIDYVSYPFNSDEFKARINISLKLGSYVRKINKQKKKLEKRKRTINKSYKGVSLLREIGRKINSTLSIELIVEQVFNSINEFMNFNSFYVAIFNEKNNCLDVPFSKEDSQILQPFTICLEDTKRPAVECFNTCSVIQVNNLESNEKYSQLAAITGNIPKSVLCVPLFSKNRKLGVISVQSFKKDEFKEYHINYLRNIAIYTASAIENALAFKYIDEQKKIIEHSHNQILKSIDYAKKIQDSLLPSYEFLDSVFNNYFVMWQPRDIVSGDFLWVRKIGIHLFIVVADCTGHGIPGAFLSMLGISLLNKATFQNNKIHTNEILEELRNDIKHSLHQTYEIDSRDDGIDLSLCKINTETLELEYSGANNSIVIARNNKLLEYNPTRNPIGIFIKEVSFEVTKLQLQKEDVLYMFTDGYADQLNTEGKRFRFANFKELLLEINDLPMTVQKKLLVMNFEDNKGTISQTDDILILGISFLSE